MTASADSDVMRQTGQRRRSDRQDHAGHPRHALPRNRATGRGDEYGGAVGRLLDQGWVLDLVG